MRKIIKYCLFLSSIIISLAATSCVFSDVPDVVPNGERVGMEISFAVEKPQSAGTRSAGSADVTAEGISVTMAAPAGTRAEEESEDIQDLWILQFGSNGNLLTPPILLAATDLAQDTYSGYTRYTTKVELIKNSASTICMVANLNDASAFSTGITLSQFRGITKSVADKDAVEGYVNRMAGFYEGPVPMEGQPFAWMRRLVAKISLTVSHSDEEINDGFIKITSTQLKGVPTLLSYYDGAANTDWLFPAAGSGNESNFMDYPMNYGDPRYTTHVWYVPENIRGINESVTNEKLKWRIYDPSWTGNPDGTGGTSHAAHIEMNGIFETSYPDRRGPIEPTGELARMRITVYPGANVTTDYSLVRNHHYLMNVDIKSFNYRDNANRDYRIEVFEDPFIIYNYFYQGEPNDNENKPYYFIGTDYRWEDINAGEEVYATPEILLAMKHLIPVTGDYLDGRADPDPITVSYSGERNIVNIYYDKFDDSDYEVMFNYLNEDGSEMLSDAEFRLYRANTQLTYALLAADGGIVKNYITGYDGVDYQRIVPPDEATQTLTVDQPGLEWNFYYEPINIGQYDKFIRYNYIYGDDPSGMVLHSPDLVNVTNIPKGEFFPWDAAHFLIPGYSYKGSDPSSIVKSTIQEQSIADMYIYYSSAPRSGFNYYENATFEPIKTPVNLWLPLDEVYTETRIQEGAFTTLYGHVYFEKIHDQTTRSAYEIIPSMTTGLPYTVTEYMDHDVDFFYNKISDIECYMEPISQGAFNILQSSGFYYLGEGAELEKIEVFFEMPNGSSEPAGQLNVNPDGWITASLLSMYPFTEADMGICHYRLYLKDTPGYIQATATAPVLPPN